MFMMQKDDLPFGVLESVDFFEKGDLSFAESISPDADEDLQCFLSYLFRSSREGHICCYIDCTKIIPEPPEHLKEKIARGSQKIPSSLLNLIICQDNCWYFHKNFICEKKIVEGLKSIRAHLFESRAVYNLSLLEGRDLTLEQKNAIITALNAHVSIICGGPGTGKTRSAIELLSLFLTKTDKRAAVCAPTGKATANLRIHLEHFKERCFISTLHSLVHKPYQQFDLIIIDESSMIDAFLMQKIFSLLNEDTQLIFLGDPDQLPPVGSGNFFKDMVISNLCKTVFLTKCLRAELKQVIEIAEKIKVAESSEIYLEALPSHEDLLKNIFFSDDIEEMFAFFRKKRILTPQRKGAYGVDTLNDLFYKHCLRRNCSLFPILITVNDGDKGLFNGDFGIVNHKERIAYFENDKKYHVAHLPHYEYGFVLSVHKSQGSEYEEVMLFLPEGAEIFGKEMLYTGVTRARKKVELFGDRKTFEKILQQQAHRLSGFNRDVF